jgi:hypothetical protein
MPHSEYSISRWIGDGFMVFLWSIYERLLWLRCKITGENTIGCNIKVMSPSERRFIFALDTRAGGYSTDVLIKMFADKEILVDEESLTEVLNHEVLHQVLDKVGGEKARLCLDNITKVTTMFNCNEKKWYFEIGFAKDGKIF